MLSCDRNDRPLELTELSSGGSELELLAEWSFSAMLMSEMNGLTAKCVREVVQEATNEVQRSMGLCVTSPATFCVEGVGGILAFFPSSPKKLYSEYVRVKGELLERQIGILG